MARFFDLGSPNPGIRGRRFENRSWQSIGSSSWGFAWNLDSDTISWTCKHGIHLALGRFRKLHCRSAIRCCHSSCEGVDSVGFYLLLIKRLRSRMFEILLYGMSLTGLVARSNIERVYTGTSEQDRCSNSSNASISGKSHVLRFALFLRPLFCFC